MRSIITRNMLNKSQTFLIVIIYIQIIVDLSKEFINIKYKNITHKNMNVCVCLCKHEYIHTHTHLHKAIMQKKKKNENYIYIWGLILPRSFYHVISQFKYELLNTNIKHHFKNIYFVLLKLLGVNCVMTIMYSMYTICFLNMNY